MARENRVERRILGSSFKDFLDDHSIASRIATGDHATYVFLKLPRDESRDYRQAELRARMFVARDRLEDLSRPGPVVGLATEIPLPGGGFSFDFGLLETPIWTAQNRTEAAQLREAGFFKNPREANVSVDEYPRP